MSTYKGQTVTQLDTLVASPVIIRLPNGEYKKVKPEEVT
jgi:hypothetical protein